MALSSSFSSLRLSDFGLWTLDFQTFRLSFSLTVRARPVAGRRSYLNLDFFTEGNEGNGGASRCAHPRFISAFQLFSFSVFQFFSFYLFPPLFAPVQNLSLSSHVPASGPVSDGHRRAATFGRQGTSGDDKMRAGSWVFTNKFQPFCVFYDLVQFACVRSEILFLVPSGFEKISILCLSQMTDCRLSNRCVRMRSRMEAGAGRSRSF